MPLSARLRPGATRRPFVDREPVIAMVDAAVAHLAGPAAQPQVLVLTGVGGIGKSRLLGELGKRVAQRHPTATLDLQVPAQRQPETALAVLRSQFGRAGVTFPRFDIAYTVLWQRLHPHLRLSAESLSLAEHSEILTEILDQAAGVPLFGTAAKLVESGTRRVRRWHWMRQDVTLQELDLLGLPALTDAVIYLFAEDLKAVGHHVLFVDAYEALVGGVAREGSAAAIDGWLRDIIAQLDTGLVVMAGREPVGWERHNPEWAARLRTVDVGDLPVEAQLELLAAVGIADAGEARRIALSSGGLPFYLHLAIDARNPTDPTGTSAVVAPEMILERFLHHVHPAEIRLLELLAVARTVDYGIFTAVAEAFGLAAHRSQFESIIGYSFVRDAGPPGQFQLHQLMVEALRHRLDTDTARRLHGVLYDEWAGRAHGVMVRPEMLREAAFHGVRAGRLDASAFLQLVDRIVGSGGAQALDQVTADVERYLVETAEGPERVHFTQAVRYLHAEAAVLLGNPIRAEELTADVDLADHGPVADRVVVVAAHARRMRGRTAEALAMYTAVVDRAADGPTRRDAGLWAADLHMAQGRFADAMVVTDDLLARASEDDLDYLAEVERLRSLACRFAFDLGRAAGHLDRALQHSAAAGSPVARANLAVNRAELLALTDPPVAVLVAGAAIEAQRELGSVLEVGKAYTALGLARLAMGELDAAEQALTDACGLLDRVGYRSGRARAELFRALVAARRGGRHDVVRRARWAVAELEAISVYPALVVAAETALAVLGWHDRDITRSAILARARIQPLPGSPELSSGVNAALSLLLGIDPEQLYREAIGGDRRAAGFYNHNVRCESPMGTVNVRVPVVGADQMDLRLLPEPGVLRALSTAKARAPRLRWASSAPPFQVHDYVEGVVLDELAPRGEPVPDHVVTDVVALFRALGSMPRELLPELPASWPEDVCAVAERLSALTGAVISAHRPDFGSLWSALGIPEDPLDAVTAGWRSLQARPFRLVHSDVHRKNMIIAEGGVVFIDWELALWADPLYDVAVHLHKMAYLAAEEQRFLIGWQHAEPVAAATSWRGDLQTYLDHERVKSALVDSVRYAKLLRSGELAPVAQDALVRRLVAKLGAARVVWGQPGDVDPEAVRAALRSA
ncbi:MAG: phosphotransferase [Pseudonocardia sp.]